MIDDDVVTEMPAAELRQLRRHKLSMVFQHFGLFPHRTIIDNVAYGLKSKASSGRNTRASPQRMLELVNLKGWDRHYPSELSGGMQQRWGWPGHWPSIRDPAL
ncbi:MAG: ATP-binding cassette domain-containing protein [Caldilineaceae bacterium]